MTRGEGSEYSGERIVWTDHTVDVLQLARRADGGFRETITSVEVVSGLHVAIVETFASARVSANVVGTFSLPSLVLRVVTHGRDAMRLPGRPDPYDVSEERLALYSVHDHGAQVTNLPGVLERQVVVFATPELIDARLDMFGMAAPLRALLRDPREGINPRVPHAVRRIALEMSGCPYVGDLRRATYFSRALELLSHCALELDGDARDASLPAGPSARLAAQARELLDGELDRQLDIPRLERELRTPARTITQAFRQQLGTTIVEYVASARMTRARELVEQGDLPIKRIASMVGFAHVSNFTSAFVRRHGITPARCRARQRGG